MIEITGNWIGYYTFGDDYGEWGRDRRVPFRMTIKKGINEFVGRIFEETDFGGIDDEITIRGRQNGEEIEFTKHYTKEHLLDENFELVSLEGDNPTIVYYKGKFDLNEHQFKGEWEIPLLQEDEEGVLQAGSNSGQWFIWRDGD